MSETKPNLAAVVLDFDGIILESVDVKTAVFAELFLAYPEKQASIMEYHLMHNGISRMIKLKHIFENILGQAYTTELEHATTERFSALAFERVLNCPFVPGALEFLKRFSGIWPLYVASATPHEELTRIIQGRHLNAFLAGHYGHPTNKGEVLEQTQRRHNAAPDQILYVGDSQEDLNVAQKAGVHFVGRRNKETFSDPTIPVFKDLIQMGVWLENWIPQKSLA
jgi:beta-phosphoglucomutase